MSSSRLKGQEVTILLTRAGVVEDSLTDIQNFNIELEFEVLKRGYLGQKSEAKDDIFNGSKGDLELHTHNQNWIALIAAVKARAQRLDPTLVINISAVLSYPDGDDPTIIIPDVKFGGLPINVSARNDYVKKKITFESEDILFQLA